MNLEQRIRNINKELKITAEGLFSAMQNVYTFNGVPVQEKLANNLVIGIAYLGVLKNDILSAQDFRKRRELIYEFDNAKFVIEKATQKLNKGCI